MSHYFKTARLIFRLPRRYRGGFTVIELVVTTAIFVTITAITLANYPRFSNKVALDLLAHDIALALRQAQTFGLGIHEFQTGSSGLFPSGYGVSFAQGEPNLLYLFADINRDSRFGNRFNAGTACGTSNPGECVEQYHIPSNFELRDLCVGTGGRFPDEVSSGCGNQFLDLSFYHPKPASLICAESDTRSCSANHADAEIVLGPKNGLPNDAVLIEVTRNGQISVVQHP